jgi:hypothetical protein
MELQKPVKGSATAARRQVAKVRVRRENAEKAKVREREQRHCRFPLCPCHRLNWRREVAHKRHKGMGGQPEGSRSLASVMMLVCHWRHQAAPVSLHSGRWRWEPLTDQGTDGPVSFHVSLDGHNGLITPGFVLVATERAPGVLEELLPWQRMILETLARMEN